MLLLAWLLAGCATYGSGVQSGLYKMSRGDYSGSIRAMRNSLSPQGNDRLLYHLELGLLQHLDGHYRASIQRLDTASRIADELYTRRAGELLAVAMSNPRNGPYRGGEFERVFIHYYQSLNYLLLASAEAELRGQHLQAARVEARKVDILLSSLEHEKGDYAVLKEKKAENFSKLMDLFRQLSGRGHDPDWLRYREDAYLRYITGLIYELNGEYDEARIAYEKAAMLYESGYARQYGLDGSAVGELAWFDTIRMMRSAGGYEGQWQEMASRKLSPPMRERLDEFTGGRGQVVVIQHVGTVPQRGELDIQLRINKYSRELVLDPFYGGGPERFGKYAWFQAMYADHGLVGILINYQSSGIAGSVLGTVQKRFPLHPVWDSVEAMKLDTILADGLGVRVTVPYYPPLAPAFAGSSIWLDGQAKGSMVEMESLAQLALQEQMLRAGEDMRAAVAREVLKNLLAHEALQRNGNGNNGLMSLAGKLVMAVTSAAETRNWLTLPYAIRIQRLAVEPGRHRVKLVTERAGGGIKHGRELKLSVAEGEIVILRQKTISPLSLRR